jgi:ubiquinone/menaquinone biosynthesis C-methylase UbiE
MTEHISAPKITDDVVKMHEDYFVPAIYAQWAHHVTELSAMELGHSVLDVACGTGTLTRLAKLETGLKSKVVGLDIDEKMLAKARELGPTIEWQIGSATKLPIDDNQFDRVTCQFGLVFIRNKVAAIKEMLRVCKPGGLVSIAVWAPLNHSKAYSVLIDLTRRFAGIKAANELSIPWSLESSEKMDALLLSAGANEWECHERPGIATFPSISSFVETHLRVAGNFHEVEPEQFQDMLKAARQELKPYVIAGGKIAASLDADIYLIRSS